MSIPLPLRLLSRTGEKFEVIDCRGSRSPAIDHFDIITYTWGKKEDPYNCRIPGVNWNVKLAKQKLEDIKRLMIQDNIQYLWVDCICLAQDDEREMSSEIPKMYQYYKVARKCYILMDMEEVWNPQDIVDNLKFVDHILANMGGASMASEAFLTGKLTDILSQWATANWKFPMDYSTVRSAGIDLGVLNCYSTCINRVRSLLSNSYFTRVWTFQEMLLGKNITMYGAYKLHAWISTSRVLRTASVNAILRVLDEDCLVLNALQTQVRGVSSARTDIIYGGPSWWHENHKGVCNIFSAISITPCECEMRRDIFRGLLGVFSGLFTAEEVERDLNGDDIERISYAFFKQLSMRTGLAWKKLAISSGERGECDWIPVVANHNNPMTTDCFAAVVNLGRLKPKGLAKAFAVTGLLRTPKKYMRIVLNNSDRGFNFIFRGCNPGKKVKTGMFSSETIPVNDQPREVAADETGGILVQCATMLGSIMDPGGDVVQYRRRLLHKLQPHWNISDPNAKPTGWEDRCVSGTGWENPHPHGFRVHNRSMNFRMSSITDCGSRLENESTEKIACEVHINCGCVIIAPFSLIFEAITAVSGCSLGGTSATLEQDRIVLRDGLGLVQVGDIGKAFSLVAYGGNTDSHRLYANSCRSTRIHRSVVPKLWWPTGRALVREEFTHGITDSLRDYDYVQTGGSGNLLICQNRPLGHYKIIEVCVDE
ncbi:uncharacterized protein RAG0_16705 [Rhynchosporium agropyri]|uniref:Heterokaryon incompatibility domain-containing protein n=1 Tax=Rhynchosporium agropyri TaxID=914238 RepID=A0A1E1LRM9_9HELO|nr:uncharacterized protein RAG0_16705 [Rhynchosporium agropyri]